MKYLSMQLLSLVFFVVACFEFNSGKHAGGAFMLGVAIFGMLLHIASILEYKNRLKG